MKTASIGELRNDFARISKWLDKGETVEILKRGKPYASLVPKPVSKSKTLLGATPSPFPLPDDIDEPVFVSPKVDKKIAIIEATAKAIGGKVHYNFSSYGTYSKPCVGIECNDLQICIEEAAARGLRGSTYEQYGTGVIVYWIEVTGE